MAEESAATNTPEETINGVTNNEYWWPTWLVEKIEHAESIVLSRPSPNQTILSIYRVPDELRELNKEAYTPQIISIGPFHYHSQILQSMKNYKLSYFRSFMEQITKINKAEKLADLIQDSEERVRGCYAEAISFDCGTLRQIILMDASFIIELFLRFWSDEFWRDDDSIELKPLLSPSIYPSSFLELTFNFFEFENFQTIHHLKIDSEEVMHFVDFLRYMYLPCDRIRLLPESRKVVHKMYCASQLAEAGLKFKPSKDVDLLIQLGILVNNIGTTPPFAGNLSTGISFRDISDDYYDLCRQLVDFRRKHWYVILKSSLRQDYFRTPWMGAATVGAIILHADSHSHTNCLYCHFDIQVE
ncbi:uncharacterized protein LOC118344700 [Juglans regia]|uniref:Uncharacterized protein LOC118344700 n=1 Tax=Juglans regia TaxID=51240 RepID=A0A6P9E2W4_JUGRE|nr:uncharacterized protein LOC118344700 [Juglans regia]